MNRKQKIILSVTGIFLVLLLLVGLTYAYFLTRINGNTNTKSISVSTANLALVYGDDDGSIIGEGEKIIPGTTFDAKTFTVTNQGNVKTDYVVVIEDVSVTYAETIEVDGVTQTAGETTTFESNDFVYTLTCTSGCNGVDTATTFPINGGILVGNSIDVGETQTYAFTLTYKETGLDQTDDMNKSLNAKLNIKDISTINPYSGDTSTLAYNIINNAITGANGTTLMSTPLTTPAEATSGWAYETDKGTEATSEDSTSISTTEQGYYWTYGTGYTINESTGKFTLTGVSTCKYNDGTCHETLVGKYIVDIYDVSSNSNSTDTPQTTTNLYAIYKVTTAPASSTSTITMKAKQISPIPYSTEKVLSVTSDDYGTSYYYRGGVEDNYVNFAGMCWRIVRIEGDGSTKLLLEDRNAECNSSTFTGNWSDGSTYAFGYDSSNRANFLNYSGGLADSFKTFQTSKLSGSLDKLKVEEWCYDDTVTETSSYGFDDDYNTVYTESEATNGWYTNEYYGAYTRIETNKKPSLVCTGKKLTNYADSTNMYVGTLTADEMSFAGAYGTSNYAYYLMNDYAKNNYLYWWSISPYYFDEENGYDLLFFLTYDGYLDADGDFGRSSRPAVSLKSGSVITSGEGTLEKPYIIG